MAESRTLLARFNCTNDTEVRCCHSFGSYFYVGGGPGGVVYRTKDGSAVSEFYRTGESFVTSINDFGNALFVGTSPSGKIFMHNFNTGNRFYYVTTGDYEVTAFCKHNDKLYVGTSPSGLVLSFDGDKWVNEYDSYGDGINNLISFNGNLYVFIESGETIPCLTVDGWEFLKTDGAVFSLPAFKKVTTTLSSLEKNQNFDCYFGPSVSVGGKMYFAAGNRCSLYSFDGSKVEIVYQWSGTAIRAIESIADTQLVVSVDDLVYVCDLE